MRTNRVYVVNLFTDYNFRVIIYDIMKYGETKLYSVKFFKDSRGNEPIKEYLMKLKSKSITSKNERIKLKKIVEYIRILETYGTRAGEPYMKHLNGDIWELRPIDDRILFAYWENDTFVLLHHFVKKTNKTPLKELEQAKRNLNEFLERSNGNE